LLSSQVVSKIINPRLGSSETLFLFEFEIKEEMWAQTNWAWAMSPEKTSCMVGLWLQFLACDLQPSPAPCWSSSSPTNMRNPNGSLTKFKVKKPTSNQWRVLPLLAFGIFFFFSNLKPDSEWGLTINDKITTQLIYNLKIYWAEFTCKIYIYEFHLIYLGCGIVMQYKLFKNHFFGSLNMHDAPSLFFFFWTKK
jgi:hypothetical protein